jgi:hypothetical protein
MQNLDYWNTFVGEDSPETFMRNYGSPDPEVCVARFLEERGQLYGVVNQGTWVSTFAKPEQHHCLTVKVYLVSYLEDTREDWLPSLEVNPPHTPRRYREKFDPDRFPPPETTAEDSVEEEAGTYGTYIPDSEHDFADVGVPSVPTSFVEFEAADESEGTPDESALDPSVVTPNLSEVDEELVHEASDPPEVDVVIPEAELNSDDRDGLATQPE